MDVEPGRLSIAHSAFHRATDKEQGLISEEASRSGPMTEHPWRVLHVIANHEKRVVQHLASRSLEHYLPLYSLKSQWSDRTVALERPLFPCYVFTRFKATDRIAVLGTPGVLSLLGDDDLGTVSAEEISRVRNGVFEGSEGLVTELRGQCKVILTVKAIHQCFSLCVESSDLEVLNESAAERDRLSAQRLLATHRT